MRWLHHATRWCSYIGCGAGLSINQHSGTTPELKTGCKEEALLLVVHLSLGLEFQMLDKRSSSPFGVGVGHLLIIPRGQALDQAGGGVTV